MAVAEQHSDATEGSGRVGTLVAYRVAYRDTRVGTLGGFRLS